MVTKSANYPFRLAVGSHGKAVHNLERALKNRGLGAGHEGTVEDGSFKTVTINVKNNPVMPQSAVVHDVEKAAKAGSLIGWNEIGPDRYFKAIKDLGPNWNHYMPHDGGLKIPNPISWKKSEWEKLDAGFVKTHGGEAKVSPNRYITWVKLKNKDTGKTVVRMNTHLVSGAWGEHKPTTAWRREMWNKHMSKLHDLVAKFEKQGHAVVVGGDFNRDSYKVLGDQVAYDNKLNVGTHGRSTLDYLMHTRGDGLAKTGARVQGGYASDHDAVVVRYQIKG
ncbi:MAG: exonuclease/endonuclease/phosphatase family protein [Myxococcaceae bacterium]